jgi:hypothetical protein
MPGSWPSRRRWTSRPQWADSRVAGQGPPAGRRRGRYIEFCKSTFANDLTLKGLKHRGGRAHGAAYQIAPKVFHELGAEVVAIGCAPDGLNINHEVGATHPEALVRAVKAPRRLRHRAGRRCRPPAGGGRGGPPVQRRRSAVRADGHADRLARGAPAGVPGVVGTLMTNMAVEVALKARAACSSCAPRSATATCWKSWRKRGWMLGGEGSGHLLALDKHTTGDGLVSALQVLQARQHHRHLHQHAHHGGQRGARVQAEQRDGHGHGQLEEVGGADQGRRAPATLCGSFSQRAPPGDGEDAVALHDQRHGDQRDHQRLATMVPA